MKTNPISNPGPFLVMFNNLARSENSQIGIFPTLQEAEEFVWEQTQEEVKSYNIAPIEKNWDHFLQDLSGGLVQNVSELEENLENLKWTECFYEILGNGESDSFPSHTNTMKTVSNQWKVMAKNLAQK